MAKAKEAEAIEYIDMGDYTLEIDNRGPVQQRRKLPKSLRGMGVSSKVRQELEARIETEVTAPAELAAADAEDPTANLPPVETDEDVEAREAAAAEAVAVADEKAASEAEASAEGS